MSDHLTHAEMILEQLDEQWHVGEPHQLIMLAQTHALLAVAELLTSLLTQSAAPQTCGAIGPSGGACIQPAGHTGRHARDNGRR